MVVEKVHPTEEIMYTVLLRRPLLQLYKKLWGQDLQ
jgi:hypothetical protein